MNYKQKFGYALLGAGIMAIGIMIGQVITPNIEAQNNGVFDKITCRELEVVDENGNKAIGLDAGVLGNEVVVYNKHNEKTAIRLFAITGGTVNQINVYDEHGKNAISLAAGRAKNLIAVFNKRERTKWMSP